MRQPLVAGARARPMLPKTYPCQAPGIKNRSPAPEKPSSTGVDSALGPSAVGITRW